jgi:hypothetical protein
VIEKGIGSSGREYLIRLALRDFLDERVVEYVEVTKPQAFCWGLMELRRRNGQT